jgi:hypothetical protein
MNVPYDKESGLFRAASRVLAAVQAELASRSCAKSEMDSVKKCCRFNSDCGKSSGLLKIQQRLR